MSSIADIKKLKAEYEAKISNEGMAALQEEFKKFFNECPEVLGVKWRQYTPYFNDGDVCVFGVDDFFYKFANISEDEGDYEDGYLSTWELQRTGNKDGALYPIGKLNDFYTSIVDNDIFKAVFGDHTTITATRAGFEVEEYEHD